MKPGAALSLRSKLVLASLVVEVVMLGLLVVNSLRLIQDSLIEQTRLRVKELAILFNASLAPALAERDYASLHEIMLLIQREEGLPYLILLDRDGKTVASAGWPADKALPDPSPTLDLHSAKQGRFDLMVPIRLAAQEYGRLHYGLSTSFLLAARDHLLRQSLLIAGAEVALSAMLLTALGLWLTRHLAALTQASRDVAEGRLDTRVPERSADEVGQLAQSFNRMTETLHERIELQRRTEEELRQALASLGRSEAEQRHYAQEAEQERARLLSLLSAMNLGILFVGADGRVIYHNPAFTRIWTIREPTGLVGRPVTEVLASATSTLSRPDHFSRHVLGVLATREVSDSLEIPMTDGRLVTQLNYPVRDRDGQFIGHLWIYEDVTHERQTAAQLAYLAERDSLTGLYNRHRFQQELARMISDCDRGHHLGALLFFDLDEFKVINDNFGHRAGDAVLIRVASEVGALVRRNEVFARLGGDEFALLLPNASEAEVVQLAERIVRAVGTIPFRFEGQSLRLTSSLGIALYPHHAADADALIAHADAAMYQAKQAGKNTWRVYRADLDTARSMVSHLTWNDRIDHALEHGLLRLHFQGVYHASDGTLAHLEALVRMVDEERPDTLIMPGHFVPVAEKSGKILHIDRWVLAEGIRTLGARPHMPPLAINISGRSFDDPSLPQYIAEHLREQKVAPRRLMIELTETSAVTDLADAQRFIEALRTTGCGICLDDFGSGFSSFAYLKHLPVDTVKIDGMFIRNLPADRDDQVFVKAITDVAKGMGRITVAEFVEDSKTLELLKGIGVDLVQGYHLDMPRADHPGLDIAKAPV
ncbi:MAG: EAL domain-containing protein [Thiobacillaceae bacterium]